MQRNIAQQKINTLVRTRTNIMFCKISPLPGNGIEIKLENRNLKFIGVRTVILS